MGLERLRVALGLDRDRPLVRLAQSRAIYTGFFENTVLLPDPNPALPVLLAQLQDTEAKQQLVGRVPGAGAVRDVAMCALTTSLECERMYVQALCDASPELARALVSAASMKVAESSGHGKPLLVAKNGMPSGTVLLYANGRLLDDTRRKKVFNWEYTLDGVTFFPMPATSEPQTSISGLPLLTVVGFRVAVTVTRHPMSAWSNVVTITVRGA